MIIGERIKMARKNKELTQQELGDLSFVFLRKFLSIFYKVKFLLKFSLILPIILTFKHANAEHL